MLRNRYDRTDLLALVPQLGLRLEPQLAQLDRLLDDDELASASATTWHAATPGPAPGGAPPLPWR